MVVLCAAAVVGGIVSVPVVWPILGAGALLTAPFCGSMAAVGTALMISRSEWPRPVAERHWLEDVDSGANAPTASDGEARQIPGRYA